MGKLVVSKHALERYRDRVRPTLDLRAVREELSRILPQATLTRQRPAWLTDHDDWTDSYLLVTEQIVLPVRGRPSDGVSVALTCLTDSTISPQRREARNRKKAAKRSKRSIHRDKQRARHNEKSRRTADGLR